jgi:hypothetical protein
MNSAVLACSRYYLRRARRSRQFIASASPWSSGLNIVEGAIVQSNGLAWESKNSGMTAGTIAPNNSAGASFTDGGGVRWVHLPLLLVAPEPV